MNLIQKIKLVTWRSLKPLYKNRLFKFKLSNGMNFFYPFNNIISGALFSNHFENSELDYFVDNIKNSDIILDIGANAGIYSLLASEIVGINGKIYSFEPSNREFKLLELNISENNIKNVIPVKKVVSSSTGKISFGISLDGAMNSIKQTDHPNQKISSWEEVDATTIDEFALENNLTKIDFIKIDVEGAEKLVFEGGTTVFENSDSLKILFECSDANCKSFGYTAVELIEIVKKLGFEIKGFYKTDLLEINETNKKLVGNLIYNFVAIKK